MKSVLSKTIATSLYAIMFILPFSFQNLTLKWCILLAIAMVFLLCMVYSKRNSAKWKILYVTSILVFLIIIDFTERVNFLQLLNSNNPLGWRIPLSTLLLSLATLSFTIKILSDKKQAVKIPEYLLSVFVAIGFLVVLMVLLYPFMKYHYNMSLDVNLALLNRAFKYALVVLLLATYMENECRIKSLNIGLTISIGLTIILKLILFNF